MEKISENSTTDEKSLKTPETQHEKRKHSPSFSADNSPNNYQNPKLKGRNNEIENTKGNDENSGNSKISSNIPRNSENFSKNTTEITIQTNLMVGTTLTNNVQKFVSANPDFPTNQNITPLEPTLTTPTPKTTITRNTIQLNIMNGGEVNNNIQSFSVAANTRSGNNKFAPTTTQMTSAQASPTPSPLNPISASDMEFAGHANEYGLSLVMVHEFTGFIISISKTITYHWPLLLERANVQTSRTKLEAQGFLFWKLGNIIFCISTPERLVRLGLAQADFNKMSLTGKRPDKATTFPTPMDLAEGLEILGIAIKKRYPCQSSPTVATVPLAQLAPTPHTQQPP